MSQSRQRGSAVSLSSPAARGQTSYMNNSTFILCTDSARITFCVGLCLSNIGIECMTQMVKFGHQQRIYNTLINISQWSRQRRNNKTAFILVGLWLILCSVKYNVCSVIHTRNYSLTGTTILMYIQGIFKIGITFCKQFTLQKY